MDQVLKLSKLWIICEKLLAILTYQVLDNVTYYFVQLVWICIEAEFRVVYNQSPCWYKMS